MLVGVARDLLAGLVLHAAEQDLVAADGVQAHAVDELERRDAVPGAEAASAQASTPQKACPPSALTPATEISSS